MMVTPATASCLHSPIAMALLSEEELYEWSCVALYANGAAKEPQRAAEEKRLANGVANGYKEMIEAEYLQEPAECRAIARSLDIAT